MVLFVDIILSGKSINQIITVLHENYLLNVKK